MLRSSENKSHPNLDGIEVTPLPVGEGPGVRDINHYFQLSVAPYRGMITRNDFSNTLSANLRPAEEPGEHRKDELY